jgi:hypothetical protein
VHGAFRPWRVGLHGVVILLLTVLTQLGGLAWAIALPFRRRLLVFAVVYVALSVAALWVAPVFGRVALSCLDRGALQVQSPLYCALNRTYVAPELAEVLRDVAAEMDRRHPGTVTLVLDGSFPFLDGFPLLPHLSHDDGGKADLAFYYRDESGYLPGETRSPIGYFAFEDGPTDCGPAWPTLRWDLGLLQPLWPRHALDEARMRDLLHVLSEDARVGKVFVEPHLAAGLGVAHPRIRFQGCRAARHDDHVHMQLR